MTLTEPLRFLPIPFEKVWGGTELATYLDRDLDSAGPVGEVWTLVDRDGCSSVVEGGTYDGRSLRGLMLSERADLLGASEPADGDYFPLLIKLLDAGSTLSMQVHPDSQSAKRASSFAASKTEAWYILSNEPDSQLYLGLRAGVDRAAFAEVASGPGIVDLVESYPVHPGEFVFVPPGTVHAIGAGIRLIEVQENSDTTFRLYDWDRVGLDGKPRELHTEDALKSIDYEQELAGPVLPGFEHEEGVNREAELVECEAFTMRFLQLNEPVARSTDGQVLVYVVIEGRGELSLAGAETRYSLAQGETWLIPAAVGEHRFEAVDGELRVLQVRPKAEASS